MELLEYIRVLRRRWVIFVLVPLLCLACALGVSLVQTPRYTATAKMFVSAQQATSAVDLSQGNNFAQGIVQSYASVIGTPIILTPVIDKLHLSKDETSLASQVTASVQADDVVLSVAVDDSSPAAAAKIANAISEQLRSVVAELSPSTTGQGSPVKVTIVQHATVPTAPSSPNIPSMSIAAVLIGILIAIVAAFIVERLDTRIRSESELRDLGGGPILASIAFDPTVSNEPIIMKAKPRSTAAEAFRSLRTGVRFLDFENPAKTLVVTSSVAGEGKSVVTVNLGVALAEAGLRTIIVDGDLRRPRLAKYLGIDGSIGLTEVLVGDLEIDSAVQAWGGEDLSVLPSGQIPPNPSELLQSHAMSDLLRKLQEKFDIVLIDAPPLLPVTDAAILASYASGALVVCAVGRTRRQHLSHASGVLTGLNAKVLGVVASMVPTKGPDAYEYVDYAYSPSSDGIKDVAVGSVASSTALVSRKI